MKFLTIFGGLAITAAAKNCTGACQQGPDHHKMSKVMKLKEMNIHYQEEIGQYSFGGQSSGRVDCVDGMSGEYPCKNLDMLSFINYPDLGSSTGRGNDVWGWTSPAGQEYVIMCATDGTSFVRITDPENPVVVAWVQGIGAASTWRDAKVYGSFAFIISETTNHGMQYYDMSGLDAMTQTDGPVDVTADADLYDEFGSCHNIVINEQSGYAYGVGSRTCRGGLHVVDVRDPGNPKYAGCFDNDGYTHDAECVIYNGPDDRYRGKEVCFAYNEDSLTLVDVDDKENMVMISRVEYEGYAYSHQGWLNEKQTHLILDDELDESTNSNRENGYTCSYVWDVEDLRNPVLKGRHLSSVQAIDHNMYVLGDLVYQANYEAGLRVLDITDIATFDGSKNFDEVAFFDVRPQSQSVAFNGAWSTFPYFNSGVVAISSIERGLFIVKASSPMGRNVTRSVAHPAL